MMAPAPDRHAPVPVPTERGAASALLSLAATLIYYSLPSTLQAQTLIQLTPQLLSYAALAWWTAHNSDIAPRLGLATSGGPDALRWGLPTGLLLGGLNTWVILVVFSNLGYDIGFLRDTPHAQVPLLIMVPWFICGIAVFVELNFRGFVLGRLAALESTFWTSVRLRRLSPVALALSALAFAFDPFMVNTFKGLHWIALWDGVIWGTIRLRTGNLLITIVAHAVEVIVMYAAVRTALMIES